LTGNDGALMRSVAAHVTALEQMQRRFVASMDTAAAEVDVAAKKTAAFIRRPVPHIALLSIATVVLYATATFGFAAF